MAQRSAIVQSIMCCAALLALVAGCSRADIPTPTPAPAAATPASAAQPATALAPASENTPPAEKTASPAEPAVATSGSDPLQDLVRRGTVRIAATGGFRYPAGLQRNSVGNGSGFVIDPAGLAVTNNHVVTGAAILKVRLEGEQEPRHAKVVAVSECADLALIQIEGSGFTALQWGGGTLQPGLDVYAAGYPLDDPKFTLTHGTVSQVSAGGGRDWAAVSALLEHNAVVDFGGSGGPLVTKDGAVVGVNYGGSSTTGPFFALARSEAEKVIRQLRDAHDVDSIGLNGKAFQTRDKALTGTTEPLSGIWVFAVQSGSPADRAGLRAGDLLTRMEGVDLASDGTMADYCDILRSHSAADTLAVQVRRAETQADLEGQINGRVLQPVAQAAVDTEAGTPQATREPGGSSQGTFGGAIQLGAGQATPVADFISVSDDTGAITAKVPPEWRDTEGGGWTMNEKSVGVGLFAAPSVTDWVDGWTLNGAFIGVSRELAATYTPQKLLDERSFHNECTFVKRSSYESDGGNLSGSMDDYKDCGGTATRLREISAITADKEFILFVQMTAVTEQDTYTWDTLSSEIDWDKVPQTQAEPTPTPAPMIVVAIQKYDYAQWGRPDGMDHPGKGCSSFNGMKPVKKLTASLRIQNRSSQDMTDWYGYFYKPDGKLALACYMGYQDGFPGIPAGKSVDMTFGVYVETGETIEYGVIADKTVGRSGRVPFP